MKIDPSKTTPQAPLGLRAGSKGFARRQKAAMAGAPVPAAAEDDDEDDEDDPESSERGQDQEAHDAACAEAADKMTAAAAAWTAAAGPVPPSMLMAAEDAGDAAGDAHDAAKASSMKLRGAEPTDQPAPPAKPPAPAGAIARAVVAVAGSDASAQQELTAAATFGRKMLALFGGASFDDAEGQARAALADAKDAKKLRAEAAKDTKAKAKRTKDDAETALVAKLSGAIRAMKFDPAELFDIAEGAADAEGNPTTVRTPQAWTRALAPAALDAMIKAKQPRAGGAPLGGDFLPEEGPARIPAEIRAYAARRGITDEKQIAKLAATYRESFGAAPALQE